MDIFGKKQETHYRDLIIKYKRTFGSPDGKAVLFDLMSKFHVLDDHGGDPFKEGQRSAVLEIFKNTKVDLKKLDEQMSEGENG